MPDYSKAFGELLRQSPVFWVWIPNKGPLRAQSCLTLCDPVDCTRQAPLSMGFPRQGYWSGFPFPILGSLPDTGIETASPISCFGRQILYRLSHQGSPRFWAHDSKWRRVQNTSCFVGLIEIPPLPFQRLGPRGRPYDNSGLMMMMVIITIISVHKQGQSFRAFSWGKRMMGYFPG